MATTDWLVYRCEECHQTHYVNAVVADTYTPNCGHTLALVDLFDQHQFCQALDATRARP